MGNRVTKSALNLRSEIARLAGQFKSVVSGMTKGQAQETLEVSRPNFIINGDMQVSQRGDYTTSGSGPATATHLNYYLDRWYANSTIANTITHITTSQPKGYAGYSSKYTATASGTQIFGAIQSIENYADLSNRTLTFSAWVKSNNANARLNVKLDSSWVSSNASHSGDGEWEKLSLTFNTGTLSAQILAYPAITNETAGAVSITSGDYIEFTQVKLEIGDTATPFEVEPYADVLRKCQRYYWKLSGSASDHSSIAVGHAGDLNTALFDILFPIEMRDTPTVTESDMDIIYAGSSYDSSLIAAPHGSAKGIQLQVDIDSASPFTAGHACNVRLNPSTSAYLAFDAEL